MDAIQRPTTGDKKMKTVNVSTPGSETAIYWIDCMGDIHESKKDAECFGIAGKVVRDSFFMGTAQEMRSAARRAWVDAQ